MAMSPFSNIRFLQHVPGHWRHGGVGGVFGHISGELVFSKHKLDVPIVP